MKFRVIDKNEFSKLLAEKDTSFFDNVFVVDTEDGTAFKISDCEFAYILDHMEYQNSCIIIKE